MMTTETKTGLKSAPKKRFEFYEAIVTKEEGNWPEKEMVKRKWAT
jgi:hypothetical protein